MINYNKYFLRGLAVQEINLRNLSKNYNILSELSKPGIAAAVIKANAYGCGLKETGKTLLKEGCKLYFVAKIDEGIELRKFLSKKSKIAVFDGYLNYQENFWKEYGLIPVCNTVQQAELASKNNIKFMLHIDTGMNRLGLSVKEAKNLMKDKDKINSNNLMLIISHFVCSDNKESKYNGLQIKRLKNFKNFYPNVKRSISNSHGIFLGSNAIFDITRPGIALYGYINNKNYKLFPTVNLYAPILQIRETNIGDTVGYDATYKINKKSTLGILGLGYADGLKRCIGSRKRLSLGEFKVPILGRVSMDTIIVDLSKIPQSILDKINHIPLIDDSYDISDLAKDCGTIPYEILTSFGKRIKKVYVY